MQPIYTTHTTCHQLELTQYTIAHSIHLTSLFQVTKHPHLSVKSESKREYHKKERTLLSDDDIHQLLLLECCGNHCYDKFSAQQLCELRHEWVTEQTELKKRQQLKLYLHDHHTNVPSQNSHTIHRQHFNLQLFDHFVCPTAFARIVGTSIHILQSVVDELYTFTSPSSPKSPISSASIGHHLNTHIHEGEITQSDRVKAVLSEFFRVHTHLLPDGKQTVIAFFTKQQIWEHLFLTADSKDYVTLPAFLSVWNTHFPHVRTSRERLMCDTCIHFESEIGKARNGHDVEHVAVLSKAFDLHIKQERAERDHSNEVAEQAKHHPNQYLSLCADYKAHLWLPKIVGKGTKVCKLLELV